MKLSRREKFAVLLAMLAVTLFLLIQVVIFPIMDKNERLQKKYVAKKETLLDMHIGKKDYDAIMSKVRSSKSRFKGREKGFNLFSYLDSLAGQTGLKDKIAYMKPSRSVQRETKFKISLVEMKLAAITLKQLNPFLHKVEDDGKGVFIRRISVTGKTGKLEGYIDAVLHVETYEIDESQRR